MRRPGPRRGVDWRQIGSLAVRQVLAIGPAVSRAFIGRIVPGNTADLNVYRRDRRTLKANRSCRYKDRPGPAARRGFVSQERATDGGAKPQRPGTARSRGTWYGGIGGSGLF